MVHKPTRFLRGLQSHLQNRYPKPFEPVKRNLIQLLGGKIEIQRTKNSGTSVVVEIPLQEA